MSAINLSRAWAFTDKLDITDVRHLLRRTIQKLEKLRDDKTAVLMI